MENSIQNALRNLAENQATAEEIELLQQAFVSGQIFIGGNANGSVIIVGNSNTVQLNTEAIEHLKIADNRSALHQLPQPPADFVGREQELKKILKSLDKKSGTAISGLVGMGGIGKTALGLVAAHNLIEKYSEAQFFIDMRGTSQEPLKPLDAMKHIVQSVYPTADLKNATEAELAGAYQSVLAEKKSILFLDNVHDAAQVAPLLPPASCFLLITSRMHFTVSGLHPIKLDVLKEKDAVRLLVEICPRLAKPDARRIAKLCGYLPIALRLAASYLSIHTTWTADEYIANLADRTKRLELLNLEGADINVSASFEQSYQQLPPEEQKRWNMLAVFPASFKQDALASVWDMDDKATRKLADKLCQYNLLSYDMATGRYSLHDLLADFAQEKLPSDDRLSAQLRHLRHYRDVWFAAESLYTKGGDNIVSGLVLFDTEFAHIEIAYEWAKESVTANQNIASILKEIPEFVYLARLRLHSERQIHWFGAALAAAQTLDDKYNRNKIWGNIGVAYINLGEYRKAMEYYEQALEIAREIGDRQRQGFWLGNIGIAHINLGESRKAIEYFEQALEIARKIGNRQQHGFLLGYIGVAHINLGESRKAIEYNEQALEIAREIGDRQSQGFWLGNIGVAYINLGEYRKAIEYCEKALEIARETGNRTQQGVLLGYIGVAHINLGESRKAIEYYEQALEIAREIGDRQRQGLWLGYIGGAHINQGESRKAIEYCEKALEIVRETGNRQYQALWLGYIGTAYGSLGENDKAVENLSQGLEVAREVGNPMTECECLLGFGELQIKTQESGKAKGNLENALSISRNLGLREQEARCLLGFAKLSRQENNQESAFHYAQEALSIFKAIESPKLAEVTQFIESINQNP